MDVDLKLKVKCNIDESSYNNIRPCGRISYGTAGFRGKAEDIKFVFNDIGILAGLRCLNLRANIGVMITASHNPIQDNGVKIIDSDGGMLAPEWETIVEDFCNIENVDVKIEFLDSIIRKFNISLEKHDVPIRVLLAMDTRPSSIVLMKLVEKGLSVWEHLIETHNLNQTTTPALHYLVPNSPIELKPSISVYYKLLQTFIEKLFHLLNEADKLPKGVTVDCANGVGAIVMKYLKTQKSLVSLFPFEIINDGDGTLNHLCGADFVKTTLNSPVNCNKPDTRYASIDGDADRIVYYFLDPDTVGSHVKLADGDKILSLIALFINKRLKEYGLDGKLSVSIVQTAYANGASTEYLIKNLGLNPICVDTGVKNLQREARKHDIAIYFEANGHGSIHASNNAIAELEKYSLNTGKSNDLLDIILLNNSYTGDAICIMIIVEYILTLFDWGEYDWYRIYADRPNTLVSQEVKDRSIFKTINAGLECIEPKGLQDKIDTHVAKYGSGARCFVRPSGTENLVRIYAEAMDQKSSGELAHDVIEELSKIS